MKHKTHSSYRWNQFIDKYRFQSDKEAYKFLEKIYHKEKELLSNIRLITGCRTSQTFYNWLKNGGIPLRGTKGK